MARLALFEGVLLKKSMRLLAVRFIPLILSFFLLAAPVARGAKPYKIYVVNRYGAYDIVCDSYTVKKDDHIWDILRRKGSIAEQDFPRFVRILKDLNPGITDVNKIYPRQRILIPLKEMPAVKTAGASGPRYITIPMLPDVLYRNYRVQSGDCLSKIITAHLQVRWNELTDEYIKTLRRLNPRITNLDLIYPGQTIRIPALSAEEEPVAERAHVACSKPQPVEKKNGEVRKPWPAQKAREHPAISEPEKMLTVQKRVEEQDVAESGSKPIPLAVPTTQKPSASETISGTSPKAETLETDATRPEKSTDEPAEGRTQKTQPLEPIKEEKILPVVASARGGTKEKIVSGQSRTRSAQPIPVLEKARKPSEPTAALQAQAGIPTPQVARDLRTLKAVEDEGRSPTAISPDVGIVSGDTQPVSAWDVQGAPVKGMGPGRMVAADRVKVVTSVSGRHRAWWQDTVAAVEHRIGARFLDTGHCYFPDVAGKDVVVDLAAFPVIELGTGRHVLLDKGSGLDSEVEVVIRRAWKDLQVVRAPADDPEDVVLDKVFQGLYGRDVTRERIVSFSDGAAKVALRADWVVVSRYTQEKQPGIFCVTLIDEVDKYTAAPVVAYLAEHDIAVIDVLIKSPEERPDTWTGKDDSKVPPVTLIDGSGQEPFVSGLARALGWFYEPSVPLSFDYAGFQVETTASVIYSPAGSDIVVDFGTFYGDTVSALEAGGMQVVSVQPDDAFMKIAVRLLDAMGVGYSMDPELIAANRAVSRACSITVSGCLITGKRADKALLASKTLHPALIGFLNGQRVKVLEVKTTGP
ncbi:MAG: LysM peptidoglycan-binding domain-containing protein [Deltaproteobacteria bacterium]|nr:LysM peptidoglycan-binding domain-containing protein [Deltaproteobacteria bacterium]